MRLLHRELPRKLSAQGAKFNTPSLFGSLVEQVGLIIDTSHTRSLMGQLGFDFIR